ncbi:MAG TPA: hypothetical protein PK926_03415 [Spirochaetota bacterium]|nr:hypothetical protein [Spirochaetota bacterium]HPI88787.1 hypothetical protein [Spirochaetota bacterium]HPR47139.1 hypothetical protein [Spirochaetota bacterium]
MVLKLFLEKPGPTSGDIAPDLGLDAGYFAGIPDDMAAEGIVSTDGGRYRV